MERIPRLSSCRLSTSPFGLLHADGKLCVYLKNRFATLHIPALNPASCCPATLTGTLLSGAETRGCQQQTRINCFIALLKLIGFRLFISKSQYLQNMRLRHCPEQGRFLSHHPRTMYHTDKYLPFLNRPLFFSHQFDCFAL